VKRPPSSTPSRRGRTSTLSRVSLISMWLAARQVRHGVRSGADGRCSRRTAFDPSTARGADGSSFSVVVTTDVKSTAAIDVDVRAAEWLAVAPMLATKPVKRGVSIIVIASVRCELRTASYPTTRCRAWWKARRGPLGIPISTRTNCIRNEDRRQAWNTRPWSTGTAKARTPADIRLGEQILCRRGGDWSPVAYRRLVAPETIEPAGDYDLSRSGYKPSTPDLTNS